MSAKIQMARVRWLWRLIAPTLIMIAVLWILLYPSVSPFLSLWILKLGWDNLAQALSILLRLTVIALGTFLWLFTTNQAEIVLSLVYLGLPYEFGLMLSIAFEQIPGLSRTFATVKQSYMARALGTPTRVVYSSAYMPLIPFSLPPSLAHCVAPTNSPT